MTGGTTTNKAQKSRRKEKNKIRADLNDIQTKKQNKTKNLKNQKIQELFLWKDKQNWQDFKQTHQEKKREDPNKHNQKWKRDYNWDHRKTEDYKKLLWRTLCNEIWRPKWNGQISKNI